MSALDELLAVWDAGEASEGEHDLDRLSRAIENLRAEPRGELLEVIERRRHTGIIWAVPVETPIGVAVAMQRELAERYPSVIVAVAPGTAPLAFEWDEP